MDTEQFHMVQTNIIDVTDNQGSHYRTKAGEEECYVIEVPVCDHNFYVFVCENEKLFFTEDYQLINVKEMRELESHHFATTNVIIDSGKNHQTIE